MIRRLCIFPSSVRHVRGQLKSRVLSRQQQAKCISSTKSGNDEDRDSKSMKTSNVNFLQSLINEDGEKFLAGLDEEMLKEKEDLEFRLNIWRAEDTKYIPDKLTPNDWKILLTNNFDLSKKLQYLKKVYVRQEKRRLNAEADNRLFDRMRQPYNDEDLNILLRGIAMRKHLNQWNGMRSLLYGRPLVIDMDYVTDEYETFETAQQVELLYKFNCEHIQPCHLHFTSAYKNRYLAKMLKMNRNLLADFHSENFLQVFPKKSLFYLVPEGQTILEENLDEDLIFVLGGIGGTTERGRSYAKAKSLGIPFGSLPIDQFVSRKVRSTNDLYCHIMMKIMLDKFQGVSWKTALDTHLPDKKFEKYPGLVGPVPSKMWRKSYKQFEMLEKTLKLRKKS